MNARLKEQPDGVGEGSRQLLGKCSDRVGNTVAVSVLTQDVWTEGSRSQA